MSFSKTLAGLILFFLCSCFALPSLQAAGALSGIVISADTKEPIEGSTVKIIRRNRVIAQTKTKKDGSYQFPRIRKRVYAIVASAPNFQSVSRGIRIRNNRTSVANFALKSTQGTIKGRITDASNPNIGIANANIQVIYDLVVIGSAKTDANGNYSLSGLTAGSYTLIADATQFQDAFSGVIVSLGKVARANFSLKPDPGAIEGTVVDAVTKAPIEDALIEVLHGSTPIGSALTDQKGRYTVSSLAPGNYTVIADEEDYQDTVLGTTVVANETTTQNFALLKNVGAIEGTVINAITATPISGAVVEAFSGPTLISSALTDIDGVYAIENLAPSNYTLIGDAKNYQNAATGALVIASQTSTANFALATDPGKIAGTMIDASTRAPIIGGQITVLDGSIQVKNGQTDANGAYEIQNLAPGNYTLIADKEKYQDTSSNTTVVANQKAVVNFSLKPNPGAIVGKMQDLNTEAPIAGGQVSVFKGATRIAFALTDVNGNYAIQNLAPGHYKVIGDSPSHQNTTTEAVITASQKTAVHFSLASDPGTLRGNMVDALTNSPVIGGTVEVFSDSSQIAFALTDTKGNYVIQTLPPGSYQVIGKGPNHNHTTKSTTIAPNQDTTANLALSPKSGTIVGLVIADHSAAPLGEALIKISKDLTQIAENSITNLNGSYALSNLPSGTYTIFVDKAQYAIAANKVVITADKNFLLGSPTSVVNFDLGTEIGSLSGTLSDATTGQPIAGATIQIFDTQQFLCLIHTDSNGDYNIPNLPPGIFTVNALATGFNSQTQTATIYVQQQTHLNFVLAAVAPPKGISGRVFSNHFPSQIDRIHRIQWQPSPNNSVVAYRIYRNGTLIATIPSSAPLTYDDHDRNKRVTDTYSLRAVNSLGQESSSLQISLR